MLLSWRDRPKPNDDGSCAKVTVQPDENCSTIAAANGLEVSDIEEFNKNTWGWNGCAIVWKYAVICISKGSPPMPSPMANAVCGPQVPGTKEPSDKKKLADLNPCPLNACCDIWGQCGTTAEFCTDTNTGAPVPRKRIPTDVFPTVAQHLCEVMHLLSFYQLDTLKGST